MGFILGLTGGIGSGKSAASAWFQQQHIDVIDADIVAREIVAPGQPALQRIQDHFGDWVLQPDGTLDRRALRDFIFLHPNARKELEAITHPLIRQSIEQQLKQATSPYVILVSPLLFESKQHLLTDHTLLIDAPEELQLQRASLRDTQNIEQIKAIMTAQMSRAEKQNLAHDVVMNNGSLDDLYQQLEPLHQTYLSRQSSSK